VNLIVAAVLGIVEGLTEYLPVSSTGHLVLVGHLLGTHDDAAKSFEIVIQLGALMAVVVHYRSLLAVRVKGLVSRDTDALRLALALLVAFVPTAIMGLLLRKIVQKLLFGPIPVAAALVVGGAVMIAVERFRAHKGEHGLDGLEHVTPRRALAIGIGQCFSLWPGTSRSMCTIVAGQLSGLSTATAAAFSFLLALPTLGAATVYELVKSRKELFQSGGGLELLIGMVVSFGVAWAVISGFLSYLRHRGLAPFGYYRIALGVAVLLVTLP
jgi:undecaprenyl-diphosphatase